MAEPTSGTDQITLHMTNAHIEKMDALVARHGLAGREELLNIALSLFTWSAQEAGKGRWVASLDPATGDVEALEIPGLSPEPVPHVSQAPDII